MSECICCHLVANVSVLGYCRDCWTGVDIADDKNFAKRFALASNIKERENFALEFRERVAILCENGISKLEALNQTIAEFKQTYGVNI